MNNYITLTTLLQGPLCIRAQNIIAVYPNTDGITTIEYLRGDRPGFAEVKETVEKVMEKLTKEVGLEQKTE